MLKRTSYEFTLPFNCEMERAELTAFYRLIEELIGHSAGIEFAVRDDQVEITITTVDAP